MEQSTAKSAPKRRRRRKEARPAELIEAGLLEFADKGFAATRLEDVAARAGVVKGTIYLYFDNKEALFREAILSRIAPAIADVQGLIETFPGDTESLLRLIFRILYQKLVAGDVRIILRIMIAEGPRFPEILEFYHANTIAIAKRVLTTILKRGIDRGEFRPDLPVDQPIIVVAPAIVAAIWRMTFDPYDPLDIDAYADAHADIILKGLLTRQ
ncbi:MAG: TetR family transcriptional regulator [Oricola sp.]